MPAAARRWNPPRKRPPAGGAVRPAAGNGRIVAASKAMRENLDLVARCAPRTPRS